MNTEKYSPKWLLEKIESTPYKARKLMYIVEFQQELQKEAIDVIQCCKSDSELLPSKVVKLTNQWLEDGDYYNDFDVEGRYTEVWVKEEEFEANKCHTKP
jgi:hypothetical protein